MKTFINVAQMKLASLKEGQFVETGGYYTKGGAGQAKYLIVAPQAADGYGDHTLANGTVAVLQVGGKASVQQFGAVGDGVTDDQPAIQAAIIACVGKKLTSTIANNHLIESELDVPSNSFIDLQGAAITDNVQGFWSLQAVRAAPLFSIFDIRNVSIKNFVYVAAATRHTVSYDIPTGIINIGKQGSTSETVDINISGIQASTFADHTIFISVMGEASEITVDDIKLTGDCAFGINIEYGIAPTGEDTAGAYGAHPHNIKITNFTGLQNSTCRGFLRTAGCYNITFENCSGYNVRRFIYSWTGDRGIQRVDQTVRHLNCSHYATGSFLIGVVNNNATVIATEFDGSTGDPLPVWTNRDVHVTFENCQFENNGVEGSAGIRLIGAGGKVDISNSVFKNCGYGIRMGGSAGIVTTTATYSLSVRDCTFKDNKQDLRLIASKGSLFESCVFKDQVGALSPIYIEDETKNNTFKGCSFYGMNGDISYVEVLAAANENNRFIRCNFEPTGSAPSIKLLAETKLIDCTSDDLFDLTGSYLYPSNWEGEQLFTPSLIGSTSGSQAGTGTYNVVGGMLYFRIEITSPAAGRALGNLTITGLPKASKTGGKYLVVGARTVYVDAAATKFIAQVTSASSILTLFEERESNLNTNMTNSNLTGTAYLTIVGAYSIY